MKKNILFSLLLACFVTTIIALQIVNFDNKNINTSLIFNGNETIRENITFNKDAILSSAYLTLDGSPLFNLTNSANIGPGLTTYFNFTLNNQTVGSGDLQFATCIFECSYKLISASGSSAIGWSSFYNQIPDCYNVTYTHTSTLGWNNNQFLCVNDSLGIIKLIQFTMNGNYPHSYINFTWINYDDFNYSELSNVTFTILNNNTYTQSCYQESANVATSCGGLSTGTYYYTNFSMLSNSTDGNWDTDSFFHYELNQYILINYSKPLTSTNNSLWQIKVSPNTAYYNYTFPSSCWNAYNDKLVLRVRGFSHLATDTVDLDCYNGANFINIAYTADTGVYEEAIIWSLTTDINIFNYSNIFNINTTTRNFYLDINVALNDGNCDCYTCSLLGNNCTIGFDFHSDTAGILELSNLSISWTEDIKPSLEILKPLNIIYNASSFPVAVLVSDNWAIDECLYWITKNNTITRTNTSWDCANITVGETVSGDYVINICSIDIFNNQNCSIRNYSMNVPAQEGGGGYNPSFQISSSIGVTEPNAGNWTMATDGNSNSYDMQMTESSSRNKQMLFENFGTETRQINLVCEDVEGSLCQYTTFEPTFILPVLSGIKTSKPLILEIPKQYPKGVYRFNIYSQDQFGNKQVITFNTEIGNFGFITNAIVKAGSSYNFNGFNIPYLLIGLFIGSLVFISSYFVLKKKSWGTSISFVFGLLSLIISIAVI